MGVALADGGGLANIPESFGVARSDAGARFDLGRKAGPLAEHDGGLDGVEAAVHAHEIVVVPADASVVADGAHFMGEVVVRGEECSAVAVAPERLRGVEAGAGDQCGIAAFHSMAGGAETLGGVFDNREVVFRGDGIDGGVVRHLPEEAHGKKGFGAGGDGGFDLVDGDVVVERVDVHEDGPGPDLQDHLGGADPGEGNRDNLVAVGHAEGAEGDFQAIGAAGNSDGVFGAGVVGERGFKFGDFGAHDEATVGENAVDAFADGGFVFLELRLEVDEVHGDGSGLNHRGHREHRATNLGVWRECYKLTARKYALKICVMKSCSIMEAQHNFAALVRRVEAGGELVITRRRKPVAKIVRLDEERVEFPDFKMRARKVWGGSWRGAGSDELLEESRGPR